MVAPRWVGGGLRVGWRRVWWLRGGLEAGPRWAGGEFGGSEVGWRRVRGGLGAGLEAPRRKSDASDFKAIKKIDKKNIILNILLFTKPSY